MTDETKKAIETFVLQAIDAAKVGAEWTAEQAPLLVQEWLRWQAAEAIIGIVIGSLLIALMVWFIRQAIDNDWEDAWPSIPAIVSVFGGVFGAIVVVIGTFYLAKVLISPRLVVLEQFLELIK